MAEKKYLDLNGLGYTIRKMDEKKADLESPVFTGTPIAPTAPNGTATQQIATTEFINNEMQTKQDILISGTNIKTINGKSLLGEGNIKIQGEGYSAVEDVQLDGKSILDEDGIANIELVDYVKSIDPTEGTVPTQNNALYKNMEYTELNTNDKTVFGAINELLAKPVICTISEYENLTEEEKMGKFFFIYEEE